MIEIKFRAWNKIDSKMYYEAEQAYNGHWQMNDIMGFGQLLRHPDYEVMQYTGFMDRNHKMIYDGDIVDLRYATNYKPKLRLIIFQNGAFRLIDEFSIHTLEVYAWDKIPVVGNIYQNPEVKYYEKN